MDARPPRRLCGWHRPRGTWKSLACARAGTVRPMGAPTGVTQSRSLVPAPWTLASSHRDAGRIPHRGADALSPVPATTCFTWDTSAQVASIFLLGFCSPSARDNLRPREAQDCTPATSLTPNDPLPQTCSSLGGPLATEHA